MSKTKVKRKPGRNKGKQYAKPLSLYPLTLKQAIRILVPVKSNGSGNGASNH